MAAPQDVGKALASNKIQFNLVKKNVKVAHELMAYRAMEVAAYMGIDLLAHSLPRVPWDTGELRKSGRVHLQVGGKFLTIARGRKSGRATVYKSRITISKIGKAALRARKGTVFVHYHKIKNGKDIGVWTHENLNPQESRPNPPAAVKPGTGPKYLEMSLNQRKSMWGQLFKVVTKRGVSADLAKIAQVVRKKKSRYEVDLVKLVHNKIRSKGYFGR